MSGANYQWLDCNNNYAVIPGATSQVFAVPADGSYALKIENNGCLDTSDCITVDKLSVQNLWTSHIRLYPNPSNVLVHISGLPAGVTVVIEVLDIAGRAVKKFTLTDSHDIDISSLANGIYTLRISTGDMQSGYRVIKE